MSSTILDSYKQLIDLYNQYRRNGDTSAALRMAHKIVGIADEQCAMQGVAQALRDYYRETSAAVKEFIADVGLGARVFSHGAPNEEDKIKATDWFAADVPNLTMRDVAGLSEVRNEFMVNIFAPLSPKYAPVYKKYRREMGLQILLYGPPGTGKTHIVKCLAGQLGCKIAVVQIKDVMANLVGDGAKIIAEIFEQAKRYQKCIIFFDEIDAIAASREDDESRHTKEQLTTLLTNMDGFLAGTKPDQIRIIVAATNRPWVLDSAIKRGGRFDTQIYVPLPDLEARKQLVALALGKDKSVKDRLDIPCAEDVTVEWLAEQMDGYAGADIKAICRQIINRPLRREIEYLSKNKTMAHDCIRREDCISVLGKYINSITDEMLFCYDAYAANVGLSEYLKLYRPIAREKRKKGEPLPGHVLRWLDWLDSGESKQNNQPFVGESGCRE